MDTINGKGRCDMLKKCILWALVVYLSIQIFSFSGANGKSSNKTSQTVTKIAMQVVKKVYPESAKDDTTLFKILHTRIRKTAHFLEFLALAILSSMLCKSYNLSKNTAIIIGLSYVILFAVTDEIHQLFVDGRSGSVKDVMIDSLGALTGVFIYDCVYKFFCYQKK